MCSVVASIHRQPKHLVLLPTLPNDSTAAEQVASIRNGFEMRLRWVCGDVANAIGGWLTISMVASYLAAAHCWLHAITALIQCQGLTIVCDRSTEKGAVDKNSNSYSASHDN